jgi:hypothetical protein
MNADVHVYGLSMTTIHIADIGMDVVGGTTVVIPAAKASRSKDLWRLIAQKQLFRLGSGPIPDGRAPLQPTALPADHQLREENRLLLEQNRLLRLAIDAQGGKLDAQGGKLDAILGMLSSGAVAVAPRSEAAKPAADLVEIETPTYIPSEIKPQNVESHVEVQSATTEGTGVADAGAALRKLRRGA